MLKPIIIDNRPINAIIYRSVIEPIGAHIAYIFCVPFRTLLSQHHNFCKVCVNIWIVKSRVGIIWFLFINQEVRGQFNLGYLIPKKSAVIRHRIESNQPEEEGPVRRWYQRHKRRFGENCEYKRLK